MKNTWQNISAMRNKNRAFLIFLFFAISSRMVYADFMVHFKDGTSRQVTRIVLHGEKADLVLPNKVMITVPREGIDYRYSGIQEPDFPDGICTNGKTFEPAAAKKSTGISQEQLKEMWEQSPGRTVTALKNAGSIHKGQSVRILSEINGTYTILAQDSQTGEFRRIFLASESYEDTFAAPATAPPKPAESKNPAPAPARDASSREWAPLQQAAVQASDPAAILHRPSLLIPAVMSIAILIVGLASTLAIAGASRSKKKH